MSYVSVYDWDSLSEETMFYYCLGTGNHVNWHEGWDFSFEEHTINRVWMQDWVE